MFVQILETDDAFSWQPVREETGEKYETVFQLKIVSDDVDKDIRKRHTKAVWDKKQRRMVDKLDEAAYVGELLEQAIVDWTGVKGGFSGKDVPCTADMKARLPEKWKAEILRLCAGKEGGEIASADEEKKRSSSTSPGNPTA